MTNFSIFPHFLIGSVVKSMIGRSHDINWDPLKDTFSVSSLAMDLTLWALFSLASLCLWLAFRTLLMRVEKFGASSIANASDQPSKNGLERIESAGGNRFLSAEWTPLDERGQGWWLFTSLAVALAAVWAVALVEVEMARYPSFVFSWDSALLLVIATVLLHELIHMLVARYLGLSARLQFNFGLGAFAVVVEGGVSRNGLMLAQISPFVFLTLIPLVAACFVVPSHYQGQIFAAAAINAFASGADLVACMMTWRLIPEAAELKIINAKVHAKLQS